MLEEMAQQNIKSIILPIKPLTGRELIGLIGTSCSHSSDRQVNQRVRETQV